MTAAQRSLPRPSRSRLRSGGWPTLSDAAAEQYAALGTKVSGSQDLPEHGVTVILVELPDAKIELLYPFGDSFAHCQLP
ncbi:hypothetical protein ABIC60_000009 [Phyllobacterium ifriqiyense]